MALESYFHQFRQNTVGNDLTFESPYGTKQILYADWIASGRLYRPIEEKLLKDFGPWLANTHSDASITGAFTTEAYLQAQKIIKAHVGANETDVLIAAGSGMTHVINKFQRLLGLRVPGRLKSTFQLKDDERPVVFLTHMEHHSNHTSWLETLAEVVVLQPNPMGLVDPSKLEEILLRYQNRPLKIGSFTAASNVTGIETPYHDLAKIMHRAGGYCFVDFACSAPYVPIQMHPSDTEQRLDAIFFSPHKFLGGPGTPGILVFNSALYDQEVPDQPGGGTVAWTNPWGGHKFVENIELREDGGTPPYFQTIQAALAVRLKEAMDPGKMREQEELLLEALFRKLDTHKSIHILAGHVRERLGAVSFYADEIHYGLFVKLLNDRFGIQARGGCSCAGTYGHYLLEVDPQRSNRITAKIDKGDLSEKPGWVRVSLHPTMTVKEAEFIGDAILDIVEHHQAWALDYGYSQTKNEFIHRSGLEQKQLAGVAGLFHL